ncbi:hypothetical protein ACFQZS_01240 [Mucilaginibacter calamicampi]|uniref:Uncharacterized protein n=1 Tax=Mucilaginibacter calamicampi TaxID=1302352 RepID=A0ABW2YW07_9SPHI
MPDKSPFIKITSWVIIAVSVASIAGWLFDIELLKTALPGFPSMKVNTAICLLLCGTVALFFIDDAEKHFNIIIPLNLIAFVLSALTLFEYAFDVNLRIDEFLVKESAADVAPGRMALTSASCLAMLTMGFAFVTAQAPKMFNMTAQLFFMIVAFLAILAITGYIFDMPFLHNLSMSKSMALLTAGLLLPQSLVYMALLRNSITDDNSNSRR